MMDHTIGTLAPCRIVDLSRDAIERLMLDRPRIAQALNWVTLVDQATLREWIVNIGRREADARVAHLFCEMHQRLAIVGLVSNGSYEFPVTQLELGDMLGLSTVHVNRTMQGLRARGLITSRGRTITVPNREALCEFAGFDPNYLHLDRRA